MLNNLRAEYIRKGIVPYKGIMHALGCSERTARNKLSGRSPITVPEAYRIITSDFNNDGLSIEYLFREASKSA